MPAPNSQRISELKRLRGYFAAFGQDEKVRAADKEIAELRAAAVGSNVVPPVEVDKPEPVVESADEDVSDVETADSAPRSKAAARKRAARSRD